MRKWINNMFKGQLASAVLYIAIGIVLIAVPMESLNAICMIFGIGMMILGGIHVGNYMRNKESGFLLDLFTGLPLLIVGAFLIVNPAILEALLPIILGAVVILDSIWTFKVCFEMKRLNFTKWYFLFIVTLAFAALGIVMIVNPFDALKKMMIFIGIVYLLNGILDVFFLLFLKKKDSILERMSENMMLEAQKAEKEGTVIDAEVDEDGRVVEKGEEKGGAVPPNPKSIKDLLKKDVIDVEVREVDEEEKD